MSIDESVDANKYKTMVTIFERTATLRSKIAPVLNLNTLIYDERNEPKEVFKTDDMKSMETIIWRLSFDDLDWEVTKFSSKLQAELLMNSSMSTIITIITIFSTKRVYNILTIFSNYFLVYKDRIMLTHVA